MTTPFKTLYDWDPNVTRSVITGESHTIRSAAPYVVTLDYIPRPEAPSSVSITGFAEVTGPPSAGQFQVQYTTTDPLGNLVPGRTITFNASDAGKAVSVNYHNCGSIMNASDISSLQSAVNAIENAEGAANGIATLDNGGKVPPTQLSAANQGFTQSLATPGWSKLPNGLIMQWGFSGASSITFPMAFPTAVVAVNLTASNAAATYASADAVTVTGFSVHASAATNYYWTAIGY